MINSFIIMMHSQDDSGTVGCSEVAAVHSKPERAEYEGIDVQAGLKQALHGMNGHRELLYVL